MELSEYQKKAYVAVQQHESKKEEVQHWVIGLTEEAGEVAGLIKHRFFHGEDIPKAKIAEELGDTLWYIAALCTVFEIDLDAVAQLNICKGGIRFAGEYSNEGVAKRHEYDGRVTLLAEELLQGKGEEK